MLAGTSRPTLLAAFSDFSAGLGLGILLSWFFLPCRTDGASQHPAHFHVHLASLHLT
jgi:hypothetical protein